MIAIIGIIFTMRQRSQPEVEGNTPKDVLHRFSFGNCLFTEFYGF